MNDLKSTSDKQTVQSAGSTHTTVIQSAAKTQLNQSIDQSIKQYVSMLRRCPSSAGQTKEKKKKKEDVQIRVL